jgi:hypothetical protein
MTQDGGWEAYFMPGETLLWEGAPVRGAGFSPLSIFISAFGVPFLGSGGFVAITGAGIALEGKLALGLFMIAFCVPFVTVGAGLVFGPWIYLTQAHARVRYALSSRRAYIATRWWTRKMASYEIAPGADVTLSQGRRADTVRFRTTTRGANSSHYAGFDNIADGRQVFALIRQIQREAAQMRAPAAEHAP